MHVLFVCTGNICRSPVAERLTSAFAAASGCEELTSESAGTSAVVGSGMDPRSARALIDLGGDSSGFRASQFTEAHAERADLILTMTRSHRRDVLQRSPAALARTFTLLEAATLLGGSPEVDLPGTSGLSERGQALVSVLGRRRAARSGADRHDDVPDPMGRQAGEHARAAETIADALFPLLQNLCGIEIAETA